MKNVLLFLTVVLAVTLSGCSGAGAGSEAEIDPAQQAKLTAMDGMAEDYFGCSAAISGDYAVVGAYGDDDYGSDAGSAYVFQRFGSDWVPRAKLRDSEVAAGDFFGYSVAISGDYAIVGAYGAGSSMGAAYVFERSGSSWSRVSKLTVSGGATDDNFGYSVAISGDYAVVGAYGDESSTGAAYVFERSSSSWSQVAKLTASDRAVGDDYGYSVAISGDCAIVGARRDDDMGGTSGSAYVFQKPEDGWTTTGEYTAKLTASDGAAGDNFGCSAAISGDCAIVGAHGDESSTGAAYVFERSGSSWSQVAKLAASDGEAGDYFGQSVAISGDCAIVGAYYDNDMGGTSGSAYIFQSSGSSWTQRAKMTASDGEAMDYFGCSVAVSGDYAVVGAYGDDDYGSGSGSAYAWSLY